MISKFKPQTEFYTDEQVHIVEIHNTDDDEGCSIIRARVAPGVTTLLHAVRDTIERYVILDGDSTVEIEGGPPIALRPLDVVTIPAGASQRITNTGSTELLFLCVCTPRFRQEAYTDLSGNRPPGGIA
jgi:mannose-6-phosphate isomerase-like protein (cupin superfamily)